MCPQMYTFLHTRNHNGTHWFLDEESMFRLVGMIFKKRVFVIFYSDTYTGFAM